nr:UpxY family transcription antiterminator [Bacteroides intestinalis]
MIEHKSFWFAARTKNNQVLTTRTVLEKLNIEYYLPTQFTVRILRDRRRNVEVPMIQNLIFVHATKQRACDIVNNCYVRLYYMRDFCTHQMLVVPDKQMEDFMLVMNLMPDKVCFENKQLTLGAPVQIIKGELCGIEGEVASMGNHTYVVIRMQGVLSASIRVPRSYLRLLIKSEINNIK